MCSGQAPLKRMVQALFKAGDGRMNGFSKVFRIHEGGAEVVLSAPGSGAQKKERNP